MRSASAILISLGVLLIGVVAGLLADSALFEFKAAGRLRHAIEPHPARSIGAGSLAGPAAGDLIGWLEVPRLGVSAAISEGTGTRTLLRSIGHIEGTAMPGAASGNVGLAGHRDIHFRKLQQIEPGDTVRVRTPAGSSAYIVDSTQIVMPDHVGVLDSTAAPTLTLITCYPFGYVGHAPKRFVVRAERIEHDPPPLDPPPLSLVEQRLIL